MAASDEQHFYCDVLHLYLPGIYLYEGLSAIKEPLYFGNPACGNLLYAFRHKQQPPAPHDAGDIREAGHLCLIPMAFATISLGILAWVSSK
jgi:hypothetical protein